MDSASEVLKIPADAVEPSPAVFQEGGLNCVTGLGKVAGRLIVLLDMSKLLASSKPAGKESRTARGKKRRSKPWRGSKAEARGRNDLQSS